MQEKYFEATEYSSRRKETLPKPSPRLQMFALSPHKNHWAFIPQDGRAAPNARAAFRRANPSSLLWTRRVAFPSVTSCCPSASFTLISQIMTPNQVRNSTTGTRLRTKITKQWLNTEASRPPGALLDVSDDDTALLPAYLQNTFLVNEFSTTTVSLPAIFLDRPVLTTKPCSKSTPGTPFGFQIKLENSKGTSCLAYWHHCPTLLFQIDHPT